MNKGNFPNLLHSLYFRTESWCERPEYKYSDVVEFWCQNVLPWVILSPKSSIFEKPRLRGFLIFESLSLRKFTLLQSDIFATSDWKITVFLKFQESQTQGLIEISNFKLSISDRI